MDGSGHRQHRVPLGLVCLVLLVIGTVHSEDTCRTGCKSGTAQTFKYAVGTTYKYNYDGKIEISLSSAEGQSTSTEVKAEVLLTQLPDCNQLLRLQNVHISGANGKKFGSIPDIEKPIRININDGILEDSICVVDGDNQNSINVKRAIASIFQASLKTDYETDVFGRCPTEFSSHKEGTILVIQKSRSLNRCSYREHIQQDFLSTALNLNSEIKSSPILNGDYGANLRIKNGVLDQATVTEDYLYVPFSVGKNGAKAQVVSKLHFSGTSKDAPQAPVTKPRSIIFENPHPVVAPTSNVPILLAAVKEVAKTVDIVVGENTAKEFINLLKIVKVSSKSDLLAVYNQVRSGVGVGDKDAAKRLYLDALLRSGNGDSVEALLELLDKKQLSDCDSRLVLLGLNVVRHATEGSLKAAVHLLDTPNLDREAYLGVGNLAGRYCSQHNCDNVAEVKALTNKLLGKIGGKFTNREQENDAVFALKALANFHYLNDNVVPKVTGLAQNKNLPNRIRVAALEAYLADACKDKLRNSALQILQDIQQDSEVRIRAYLVLAQCPNAKIGNALKTLLTKEPSIQVGGFITSHIHALRSSANPDKALAKQFFGFSVRRNFPIDPRKYSFNGEFSYAIDTLGLGGSSEANVIYSQNSWLPRSANLNLTAEIFGHNFNFLEIETRQENLDRLIEHYFGPKGVLRSAVLPEVVKEGKSRYHKLAEYIEQKLKDTLHRNKRDVSKAEIDHIAKQVQIKTNDLNKDLDLDVSFKAFGAEVFFVNINQEAKVKPEAIVDNIIAQLSNGLDKLQRFQETLRHNVNFLNAEFDYPTSLGFPLRLAAEGSASIQVKAEGNVDVRQLINNPDKGEIRVKLIPSVNIEVSGRLTLDALVVENGLKVVSTLYSATGGDLSATWDKSTGFDVKFGLPVQEQKLISANHEIVFVTREQAGRELNLPLKFTQVKDFSICLDQLSPFIGLTFCADVNGPNVGGQQVPILPFPLAGDAKIAVTIENDDVSQYHIKHVFKQGHADLIFETIGKNNQKKVSLDLQAEYSPEKYIKAFFSSPVKSASVEGRIINTNVETALLVKLTNDKDEFSGKVGIAISGTPERAVYKPILEYRTPAGQQPLPVATEGQVVVERNGANVKYKFENLKIADSQRQLILNGYVGTDAGIYLSDLTLSDGKQKVGLEGRLQLTSDLVKFNVKLENTFNNNANFKLTGEVKRQPPSFHYDASIQLIHGADLNSKTSILTITSSIFNKFKNSNDFRFETKNSIRYPLLGVDGKFKLEHTPKTLDYEVSAEYGDLKLGSELEAKINEKSFGDYQIEFDLWGLDNKLELKSRRQVLPNDESKISNTLQLNDKKFEVEGKVRHNIRPHNVDVGTELTVHVPGQAAPIKVSTGLKIIQEEVDAHAKISSGADDIIDSFLKANKKGSANGSVKINIKNLLNVNGQIHANDGAGKGEILIDLQKSKRQLKADSTFNIQPGRAYDLTATLYPSFNKDKNLKLFLSTQNKISEGSWDSKNKLDILGNPLEVNAKGTRTGDSQNCKLGGELEVTLPGEQYFLAKINSDYKGQEGVINGVSQGSIEYRANKNTPGRKCGFKATSRNTNVDEGILDLDINLTADDSNGKNINADVSLKASRQGDTHQISYAEKVYGTVLSHPFELSLNTNYKKGLTGQYELKSSYGSANTLTLKGNHDYSGPKKQGTLTLQVATASEQLKSLNIDLRGSVVKPENPTAPVQLEGSANVQATNAKGPIVDVKSQGSINAGPVSGEVKGNLVLNNIDPIGVTLSYKVKENKQGASSSATVTYGKGQTIKYEVALDKISDQQQSLVLDLQTPFEGYKNTHLTVTGKRSKDSNEVSSSSELTVDGKTWKSSAELVLSELAPVVDLRLTGPEGKQRQFYVKANKISSRQFSGELKLINENSAFTFDGSISVNAEDLENLSVKGQVHSPNLNLNKIVFEGHNKGSSKDHKIQLVVKTAGKNYISGNLDYAAKEENGKFIIDGNGNLKVKDETRSGHFKYIIERLEANKNGEQGIQVSFDATLGDKAIDSEYKLTNKQFRLQISHCEQKKECAYIEIENKINSNDIENFNQVLEVNLDLRKLGLSHEFGLKAVTTRKQWVIDHTLDAHFQNQENSKYQYSFYLHPLDAGITLTTPKRIVAFEAKSVPPKNFREGGKGTGEIAFYLDKKNHPSKKTSLTWYLDVDVKGKVNGEAKFTHPGLRKPLAGSIRATREGTPFNGKLDVTTELDIFAQPNQKIVATYHKAVVLDDAKTKGTATETWTVKSTGLGIDVHASETISGDRVKKEFSQEAKFNYKGGKLKFENIIASKWSPTEVSGIIKIFDKVLLKGVNKIQVSDDAQVIESEISSYNNDPIVSKLEIKNYNTLAYNVAFKNQPNRRILFNAGLIPGQIADIRADSQDGGNKVNLFYATVKLDDVNFLKSDHKVDSKAIQAVIARLKERSAAYFNGLDTLTKEWSEEAKQEVQGIGELAKKAAPNLEPLKQYYSKELQEIKEEILNDKNVKELSEAIRKVLGSFITAFTELFERVSQLVEESAKILQNSFTSVIESVEKELIPQLQEITSQLLKSARTILETVLDISLGVLAKGAEVLERYQPELQELAAAFGELFQDIGRLIYRVYENSSESIRGLFNRISSELRSSAVIEELKAQYEQFLKEGVPSADAIINTIREVFNTIRDIIPPDFIVRDDINNLLDTVTNYIEKKLRNQPVDDLTVLEQIGSSIVTIARKLFGTFHTENIRVPGAKVDSTNLIPFSYLRNLPRLVAVRFSPIDYLLDQDSSADVGRFLLSLVNSPRNWVPPFPLFGLIIQGQHIFTFDGKHLTFPGKCNYLFARDAVNGNFTLAGSYKDGLLASITLADEHGAITLLQGGKVKFNQDVVELPIRKSTLVAWRNYETISLLSTSGITVECTPDLIGCVVKISGFYHSQVKGLLGNGNNEPYDDFTVPNGKIVTAEGQFGNAYKLASSCPDVTVPKHDAVAENPTCAQLFSWESSLRLCYPFVPTENFKTACAHGLAANVKGTEEAIAKAYVAACQDRNIPIHVPENLVKCTNSEKAYSVGDTFSVKLPSKSADIVLIVDSEKENQQLYDKLVKVLVPEISTELHNKGVRDIEFHLITYGGANKWPSHNTVGGKLAFKGKPPGLKFSEDPEDSFDIKQIHSLEWRRAAEELKTILRDLSLATGLNLKTRTYDAAHKYPFRVNALKSIVVFNGDQCEVGKLHPLEKLVANTYKDSLISVNLFTPFTSLSLKEAKKTKDVIGFNQHNVFTLSQAKKNPKGTSELHKELSYDDYCADFAANNRGNIFVNDNFLSANDADQKQFIRVAAVNIVEQLVNVEQGLDCECKLINPWNAVSVCREAYTKERPSKKV